MTLVSTPEAGHGCSISWELASLPDDHPAVLAGSATHFYREINRWDAPGTVRACPECGRHWVAEEYPQVRSGMQMCGVFWRPETRRERRRRERQR
jgi:hypothetical protein